MWIAPPPDFVKCNMDAACYTDPRSTSIGMIISDATRSVVVYSTSTMPVKFCCKEAEAIGLRKAIKWSFLLRSLVLFLN